MEGEGPEDRPQRSWGFGFRVFGVAGHATASEFSLSRCWARKERRCLLVEKSSLSDLSSKL